MAITVASFNLLSVGHCLGTHDSEFVIQILQIRTSCSRKLHLSGRSTKLFKPQYLKQKPLDENPSIPMVLLCSDKLDCNYTRLRLFFWEISWLYCFLVSLHWCGWIGDTVEKVVILLYWCHQSHQCCDNHWYYFINFIGCWLLLDSTFTLRPSPPYRLSQVPTEIIKSWIANLSPC